MMKNSIFHWRLVRQEQDFEVAVYDGEEKYLLSATLVISDKPDFVSKLKFSRRYKLKNSKKKQIKEYVVKCLEEMPRV